MNTNDSPRKAVLFDSDKTLLNGNTWYRFNEAMGITPAEDELLYRLGPEKEGALPYRDWIHVLTKIILKRGRGSREAIEKALFDYKLVDNAERVITELKARGYTVGIISGGFNLLVDKLAAHLGIEHTYNNTFLVFDDNDMLEDILLTWEDDRYKPLIVQSFCRRMGIHPKDAYYVADGANDAHIFEETIGVAITPPTEAHEPWMQKAMAAGEEFSSRSAVTKARYTINQLDQLLDILK